LTTQIGQVEKENMGHEIESFQGPML
jgi:hypothetical protein